MSNHSEDTKRIAKNTLLLYVRMLFGMLVSLYTSRVVLQTLGVEDYGICNVVGGFVTMFMFLNDSMSGATSRFITYELGKGDLKRLNQVFSTSFLIHLVLAFILFVLLESFGLWFLENKMVIPENRLFAAKVVFQLSILSMIVGVTQVPYNAVIISHEKLDVYAYVGLLNTFLRLLIVYLLFLGDYDRMIFYSILQLLVSILIMAIYRIYCLRKFPESHFRFVIKKEFILPMISFSGWDLYGNASVMARTQGVNMLLNVFFGPILNAASGVAAQVQGAVMGLANNLVTAVRPQIVKSYAIGEYSNVIVLLRNSLKISFVLLSMMSLPLLSEMNFILHLWLGIVPDYTVQFCRYTLLFNFFANMSLLFACVIHATGKIKRISFINGSLYLLVIPFTYISYKLGATPTIPFIFNVVAVMIGMLSNVWTVHLYMPEFSFRKFVLYDFCKMIIILFSVYCIVLSSHYFVEEGWLRFLLSLFLSFGLISVLAYYVLLPLDLRNKMISKILKK